MDDEHVTLTEDGCWCWIQDPRAVHYHGSKDRTYYGWITNDGDIQIGSYDHETGSTSTTTLHEDYEKDDHDAPSILVRSDGRILVFYSRHGGEEIHYRLSKRAETIEKFGPEQSISPSHGHTYPNPYQLAGEDGRIYLFYRTGMVVSELGEGTLSYVYSDDDGTTWSDQQKLIEPERGWCVYFKIDSTNGERIDMALNYAESGGHGRKLNVRHVWFADQTLYGADGREVASEQSGEFPIGISEAPIVYDSEAKGNNDAWVWDCSASADSPEIVYAEFQSPDVLYFRYARWSRDQWYDTRLTSAGKYINGETEKYYSGGIYLDHSNPGDCYLSVGDGKSSTLQHWRTPDGGTSWIVTNVADPSEQNVRPVVPRSRHDELPVLWMHGEYTEYYRGMTRTRTSIVSKPIDSFKST